MNFEKEIIVSFFLIRKLIEANRISKSIKETKIQLIAFPRTSEQLTNLNHWDVRELFDLDNPKNVTKSIVFLSNQLIHSLTIFTIRKDKKWNHILTCSDFEKGKKLYLLSVENMIKIFEMIAKDRQKGISYTYDGLINDYKIQIQ